MCSTNSENEKWFTIFSWKYIKDASIDGGIFNLLKPKTLTFRNSLFCPKCIYGFCVDLRTNSKFFSIQK